MSYGSTQGQAGVPAPTDAGLSPTAATGISHDDPDAHHNVPAEAEGPESTPEATTVWQKLRAFHERNFGLFLVFLAEIFASLMTMTTRLLETGFETKFHALQIIFVRMLATAILGSLYMWIKKVPDFPLGDRSVRGLLFLRGCAGFMGLFCSYYSLSYLNISDSTVISFLVPTVTAFICFIALREPFTINEASAGLIAFVGVLFIARPTFLFPPDEAEPTSTNALWLASETPKDGGSGFVPPVIATPEERSLAVLLGVLGTFGAAAAYSTIRVIGKRAHSLVSVNYFAVLATVGSCLIILVHPDLEFQLPENAMQWSLLVAIGVAGFLLQFLLTEGLQREKAGRATNLINLCYPPHHTDPFLSLLRQYTQLVFALILERIVWGTTPSGWSLIGAALIIGAALWVMLQKNHGPNPTAEAAKRQSESRAVDEESSLLGHSAEPGEDTAANTRR
ncbi:hypothetical protein PG993_014331 [Apiospora rasikravindrae]|uniref:EamA domain-containing protein n=1 Tax=Apiospora rasikravindrae TaxID=990691 RepID=A0ABR1RMM9_9PEZI